MKRDADDTVGEHESDNTPDTVRVFSSTDLLQLGLPSACKGGKVLEDRLLDTTEELRRVRGKRNGNVTLKTRTDELRFVIFELADGTMWGVSYTKHESGRVSFDKTVNATRYEYQQVLVQAAA